MKSFGERLRHERERLDLSQAQMAVLGGVQRGAQANYEKGERMPDAAYLMALAEQGLDVMFVLTAKRILPSAASLTDEEAALVDNYQHSDEEGRAAARRVLFSLAKQKRA